ncbi:MAG TPA: tetratricopeptide repeat protein [Bryobacteraceae bacterium]|nr:tetratricopeptide repeat protein [Bryobacteraceae bacterium]
MRSFLLTLILLLPAFPQEPTSQDPPEEDQALLEKQEYVLNPLQAVKELKVGAYYLKKGSYLAAARRFEEATKWDPNSIEAWFRLGEAQSRLGDMTAAKNAWKKAAEIDPESKLAVEAKRRLAKATPKT